MAITQLIEQIGQQVYVTLTAAQVNSGNTVPINIGLPDSGAGYYYIATDMEVQLVWNSVAFAASTISVRSVGGTQVWRNCINCINATANKFIGSSANSGTVVENAGLELVTNVGSAGDSTVNLIITVVKKAMP